jgi:hypothetical protein
MLKLILRKLVIYTPGFILASLFWRLMYTEAYSALKAPSEFDFVVMVLCFALPSIGALLLLNRFGLLQVHSQVKDSD